MEHELIRSSAMQPAAYGPLPCLARGQAVPPPMLGEGNVGHPKHLSIPLPQHWGRGRRASAGGGGRRPRFSSWPFDSAKLVAYEGDGSEHHRFTQGRPMHPVCRTLAIAAVGLVVAGCADRTALHRPSVLPTPGPQHLRIANDGVEDITGLVVHFPWEEITFGDVPAGTTTAYKSVAKGVYGYAAYTWQKNGVEQNRYVIDWVGEAPMKGSWFTYTVHVDTPRRLFEDVQHIVDVQVTTDG